MKTLEEFRGNLFPISNEVSFGRIGHILRMKIDFDVYLPTKGFNLQRDFVWTLLQKREFIISILLGRKIPPLCIAAILDGDKDIYKIIDGKQRLSTFIQFYNNEFTIIIDNEEFYYNELPNDYQFVIRNHYFVANFLYEQYDQKVEDKHLIEWFNRINFSGTEQDLEHKNKLLSNE